MKNYHIALLINNASKGAFATFASGLSWALYTQGIKQIDLLFYNQSANGQFVKFAPDVNFQKLKGGRGALAAFDLRKYLLQQEPDFLITAPIHVNLIALCVYLSSKKIRKKTSLIISHHHPLLLSHQNNPKDNIWLAKLLYRFAPASFGVTKDATIDAVNTTGIDIKTTAVIPNITVPSKIKSQKTAVHQWFKEKNLFIFITVSRLVGLKNIPIIIEAIKDIDTPHARLLIIGAGEMKPALEKMIDDKKLNNQVHLCGFVESPEAYLKNSDCFILASNEEGFGQVLTEAMHQGLPVISTDAQGGGPRNVLENGKWGMLIPMNDKDRLAKAMKTMMNPDTQKRYKALSIQRGMDFSPDSVGKKLISFLELSSKST